MSNYTVKEASPPPHMIQVCGRCGDEDVQTRIYVHWDKNKQDWVLDEIDWDWQWCNNCCDETEIVERRT